MAKGTPIQIDLLDHPNVKRFAQAAEELCTTFECIEDLSEIEFLKRLEEQLSLVFSLAHQVPDPYNWQEDDDDVEGWDPGPEAYPSSEHPARWQEWYKRIREKLSSDHSHVCFVYDPATPDSREVVDGELAHMLAQIYLDLKKGLILYRRSSDEERAQALWDWRFGLAYHWGRHIVEVMLPIHSLVHQHWDEYKEVFDI